MIKIRSYLQIPQFFSMYNLASTACTVSGFNRYVLWWFMGECWSIYYFRREHADSLITLVSYLQWQHVQQRSKRQTQLKDSDCYLIQHSVRKLIIWALKCIKWLTAVLTWLKIVSALKDASQTCHFKIRVHRYSCRINKYIFNLHSKNQIGWMTNDGIIFNLMSWLVWIH